MFSENQTHSSLPEFVHFRLNQDLQAIHSEVSGVIENIDIEYIHRIRIAIRRYRNNLKLFRYFADQSLYDFLTSKYQETNEFSTLLALARDLDIQYYLVEQGLQLHQNAIQIEILQALRIERQNIQNELLDYFNTSSYTLLLNHANELQITFSNNDLHFIQDRKLFDVICSSFALAISVLYQITENTDGEEVHRFRKAIRKVRYTMETFQPIIAYPIIDTIEESHLIQDLLGDMHDLDMLNHSLNSNGFTKVISNSEILENINIKHQLLHLQFVEKLNSKELLNFLFTKLEHFSKEHTTVWM